MATPAEIQHEMDFDPTLSREEACARADGRKELDATGQVFVRIKGVRHRLIRDERGQVSVTPHPGD